MGNRRRGEVASPTTIATPISATTSPEDSDSQPFDPLKCGTEP